MKRLALLRKAKSVCFKLAQHFTPLSPWRGAGGEAFSLWRGVGGEAFFSLLFPTFTISHYLCICLQAFAVANTAGECRITNETKHKTRMKKLFALALALVAGLSAQAQNVQLHYDFGHLNDSLSGRPKLTTTVEMFKPDKWGNTFFFIDMDYADNGVAAAYWEISRELKFWEAPVAIHLEYNGGLNKGVGSFNDAYLAGATYSWNQKDFNSGFSLMALYKYLAKQNQKHSWQFTATWYLNFCNHLLTFDGFADFWGDRRFSDGRNIAVFLAEPQFWVNLNRIKGVSEDFKLSLGTEWEISNNFVNQNHRWYWLPTLAAKWTF